MPDADITKRPSSNVTGLSAPKRGSSGSYTFSSTWKNPSAITSSSRDDRATHVGLYWWVDPKDDAKMKKYEIHRDFTIGTTTDSLNLNDFWANEYVNNKLSKSNVHCARSSFYPNTGTKVERISLVTIAWNPVGVAPTPWPTQYAWIKPPRKPSITVPTHAADTGVISATIATNAGQDLQERYDTRYQVTVYDSRTGKTTTQTDTSSTATSVTATYNAADRFNLGYSNFLKVTFKAWARGLAGDSATVTRTHVVAWPAQATIKKVSYSSTSGSGLCTVSIATNNNAEKHPVDGCKLPDAAQHVDHERVRRIVFVRLGGRWRRGRCLMHRAGLFGGQHSTRRWTRHMAARAHVARCTRHHVQGQQSSTVHGSRNGSANCGRRYGDHSLC